MDKYTKDGMVAVLVSPGFGAGWSTRAGENSEFYCMDRGLVELHMRGADRDEVQAYCALFGGEPYMGGWGDVEVEWLEPGTLFTIEEYDGAESLRLISDLSMTA